MTYCKPGWTPVTTELRGDRWTGTMALVVQVAHAFDVPVDMVAPWYEPRPNGGTADTSASKADDESHAGSNPASGT